MFIETWAALLVLVVLVMAGVPVIFAFAGSSLFGLYIALEGVWPAMDLVGQTALSGIKEYNFVVIPCFTVMGMLIAHSGAASDLFNVVNRRLHGVPGRLAVATVGGNAVFAAVTGVGVAAAAAFSHVAYPAMRDNHYSRSFATGCIAGSSVLGLLIPPSVFMIVWAILTEQSVGKLFAAGVIPGFLLAAMYAVYCMAFAKLRPKAAPESEGAVVPADRQQSLGALYVGLLILVTLGGIWFGFFTPTEGSAVGMIGALLVAWAKGMRWRGIAEAFMESGRTVTPIMLLLLTATMFSKLVALNGLPQEVQSLLQIWGLGPVGTMLFIVAVWFIMGCMIDSISIMLLTVPIFWPIAMSMGFDPIAFALIGILVIEAGVLTPPFGMSVFVVKAAVPDRNLTVREIFVGVTPYWLMILFLAWLIYVWPVLATWLPSRM
ncbi:MAG: TRAP transporter large permease [Comamonas sp.]